MSVGENKLGGWNKLLIGLSIAFFILLIFGITCTISGYVSANNGFRNSVFGMSVMEISDDSSTTYPFYSKVIVHNASVDDVEVGDFVAFGSLNYFLTSNNFGEVTAINGDSVTITTEKDGNTQIVSADSIAGILGTTSAAACGFVEFVLSGWTLWLFVIIPCVALIAIILVWLWQKLSDSEENVATSQNAENDTAKSSADSSTMAEQNNEGSVDKSASSNTEKISTVEEKTSQKPKKSSKKAKAEAPIENIEAEALKKDIEPQTEQEGQSKVEETIKDNAVSVASEDNKDIEKQPKSRQKRQAKRDDNYLLDLSESKRKEEKIPRLKKVPIAPPKAKRQGDDYVFRKQPSTDTNTPIKEMLDKITNEGDTGSKDKQDLLDKMKKQ